MLLTKKTLKHSNAHSNLISTFKIQVLSTLAIKCQGEAETFAHYAGNGFSIAPHFAKGYDLVL